MRLNKLCNIEDWNDPAFVATVRRFDQCYLQALPDYPAGREHRKQWEFAHVLNGLDQLNVLHPDGMVLSVAGGYEHPAYDLTNRVRWVFLTDMYGETPFSGGESPARVLSQPDSFAQFPYNRNRLVVQFMNALDLRFEENTFDAVFCLSSIEHFGGMPAARTALAEMHRVVKPGGVVAITTESVVDGGPDFEEGNLILFGRESVTALFGSFPGLALVEPIDFSISPATMKSRISFTQALEDARLNRPRYPHIVLDLSGRSFTSIAIFLRKVS